MKALKAFWQVVEFATTKFESVCCCLSKSKILISSIVIASAVHVLNEFSFTEILLRPINMLAYVLAANFDRPGENSRDETIKVVRVGINSRHNIDAYQGRYPFPRERLYEDLKRIYDAKPALLAIDLDLSPTVQVIKQRNQTAGASRQEEVVGQAKIDKLLDENADRTILIDPFLIADPSSEEDRARSEWKKERLAKGVSFGSSYLTTTFGVVIGYESTRRDFGNILGCRLNGTRASKASCDASPEPTEYFETKIRYRLLDQYSRTVEFSTREDALKEISGKYVIFGAKFGDDDLHLTPHSRKYGMDVHTAIALSYSEMLGRSALGRIFLATRQYLGAFVVDIIAGVLFGGLAHKLWERYFEGIRGGAQSMPNWGSYVHVIKLGFLFVVLVVALLVLSVFALGFGMWLSPVPIAIGMMIHGFSQSAVSAASKSLHELTGGLVNSDTNYDTRPRRDWRRSIPFVVSLITIAMAIIFMGHDIMRFIYQNCDHLSGMQ